MRGPGRQLAAIGCLLIGLGGSGCTRFGFNAGPEAPGDHGRPGSDGASLIVSTPDASASPMEASAADLTREIGSTADGPRHDTSQADLPGPDTNVPDAPPPTPPADVVHWYIFKGSGTLVPDLVGTADGTVVNTTLGPDGLKLAGGDSDQYVKLPSGMVSSLTSATVEVWLIWDGGPGYQRVFDFGMSTGGLDAQGSGTRHWSLAVVGNIDYTRLLFDVNDSTGSDGWYWGISSAPPVGQVIQMAATFDGSRNQNTMSLYINGTRSDSTSINRQDSLAQLDDGNCWFGRAQWEGDLELAGTLLEARIYDVALDAARVLASYQAGPR